MKSVARSYVNKREFSIQECVYHIVAGQWLRKTLPGVIFANSNVPEKRYRICRDEKDISELPQDSTDIFKRNITDIDQTYLLVIVNIPSWIAFVLQNF